MFLRQWKNRNSSNIIGLDIGSNFIKLLKINSTETPNIVENFYIESLPTGSVVSGAVKKPLEIGSILKNIFRLSGMTASNVALAIPRSSVIIKNVTVDNRLSEREIESRVWIEATRYFPDLVSEIYLDYMVLPSTDPKAQQLELMLVACRKEQLDPYLEVLRAAALNAKLVDVNSYALERTLHIISKQFPEVETLALLNLDLTLSTLIVVHQQNLVYAHDQTFDGLRLKNQTQDYIQKNKLDLIDTSNAGYHTVLKDNLSSHLRHAMHFFYSSRPNITLQKIILGGDCANILNLAPFTQKEIGTETVVADAFADMQLAATIDVEKFKLAAPSLLLACGLALSKV